MVHWSWIITTICCTSVPAFIAGGALMARHAKNENAKGKVFVQK